MKYPQTGPWWRKLPKAVRRRLVMRCKDCCPGMSRGIFLDHCHHA